MILFVALFLAADPAQVQRGEKLFAQSCSVGYCHGVGGAAARGPRLRGRAFDRDYLYKAVHDGIPKSAMPAWKERLQEDEIQAVVAYVMSLSGVTGDAPATAAAPASPTTADTFPGPPAAKRGMELFFALNRCGSCHALGGKGTAVGPDVSQVAKDDLPAAIKATTARRVLTVKLKDGESFPAIAGPENNGYVPVYDLTAPPPVRRMLERAEIAEMTPNPTWSHAAVAGACSDEQIAELAAYIRWAGNGER